MKLDPFHKFAIRTLWYPVLLAVPALFILREVAWHAFLWRGVDVAYIGFQFIRNQYAFADSVGSGGTWALALFVSFYWILCFLVIPVFLRILAAICNFTVEDDIFTNVYDGWDERTKKKRNGLRLALVCLALSLFMLWFLIFEILIIDVLRYSLEAGPGYFLVFELWVATSAALVFGESLAVLMGAARRRILRK